MLQLWSPAPMRSTIPVLRLREFLSPQLSLLQVLTRTSGRTSVSFGGAFASGLTSLGLDYQIVHTPYRPTEPFVQTMAVTVRLPLGNYRVKNQGLLPLHRRAQQLVNKVGHVTFEHVRREQNKEADRLSNLGMDQNG